MTAVDDLQAALVKFSSGEFESLTAALLESAFKLRFRKARSGYQGGSDVGTTSDRTRHLEAECKCYGHNTPLSIRELLGQLVQATGRNPNLEAFIIVTTQSADRQFREQLNDEANKCGLDVEYYDWSDAPVPPLAALCASSPEIVEAYDLAAGALAKLIAQSPEGVAAIDELATRLDEWRLHYERLRLVSHEYLERLTLNRDLALARFVQDIAIREPTSGFIPRAKVQAEISAWWVSAASQAALCGVEGLEGMGKTWAATDWLFSNLTNLPILIMTTAAEVESLPADVRVEPAWFVGNCLWRLMRTRDELYWRAKAARLLTRPRATGPAVIVYIDGLNERPLLNWTQLLSRLNDPERAYSLRVIFSARPEYVAIELRGLRRWAGRFQRVALGPLDDAELEAACQKLGLDRVRLTGRLEELARKPRLLRLIARVIDELGPGEAVNEYRIIWEAMRLNDQAVDDGSSAHHAVTPQDWRNVLISTAEKTANELGAREIEGQLGGGDQEIRRKLSDIVSSNLLRPVQGVPGQYEIDPQLGNLALAARLIEQLRRHVSEVATAELIIEKYFADLVGRDERSEILRAAATIAALQGIQLAPAAVQAIVTAWCVTQNLSRDVTSELASVAASLPTVVADAAERLVQRGSAQSAYLAGAALIMAANESLNVRRSIAGRIARWLSFVPVGSLLKSELERSDQEKHEAKTAEKFLEGDVCLGPSHLGNVLLTFVNDGEENLVRLGLRLLEGRGLAESIDAIASAATASLLNRQSSTYDTLAWLVRLNEIDASATIEAIRTRAEDLAIVAASAPFKEPLPKIAARRLLALLETDADRARGREIISESEPRQVYEAEYLGSPERRYFKLELRHLAEYVLHPTDAVRFRAKRVAHFLPDPTVTWPEEFKRELSATFEGDDLFARIRQHTTAAAEDHFAAEYELALARLDPEALANARRRFALSFSSRTGHALRLAGHVLHHDILLANDGTRSAVAAAQANIGSVPDDEGKATESALLVYQIAALTEEEKASAIVTSGVTSWYNSLLQVSGELSQIEAANVVAAARDAVDQSTGTGFALLLLFHCREPLDPEVLAWIEAQASPGRSWYRNLAYQLLARNPDNGAAERLFNSGWSWNVDNSDKLGGDRRAGEPGSGSLLLATHGTSVPFDKLSLRIAPSMLLKAAVTHGLRRDDCEQALSMLAASALRGLAGAIEFPLQAYVPVDEGSDLEEIDLTERRNASGKIASSEELRAAFDHEGQWKRFQQMLRESWETVLKVSSSDAGLQFSAPDVRDFEKIEAAYPQLTQQFIASIRQQIDTQVAIGRYALGAAFVDFFLRILLKRNPAQGVQLANSIQNFSRGYQLTDGRLRSWMVALFRAGKDPIVQQHLDKLAGFAWANNDQDLFELVRLAELTDNEDWLDRLAVGDVTSGVRWRQLRATTMKGFRKDAQAEMIGEVWPINGMVSLETSVANHAAYRAAQNSWAKHWFSQFLDAQSDSDAFAAWKLFLACVDERFWMWRDEVLSLRSASRLRLTHMRLQAREIIAAAKKNTKADESNLFGEKVGRDIWPWAEKFAN